MNGRIHLLLGFLFLTLHVEWADAQVVQATTVNLSQTPSAVRIVTLDTITVIRNSDTDAATTFQSLVGAITLSDGKVIAGDAGAKELRLFDRTGDFLSLLARQGRGPGEFAAISWMTRTSSDSVWIYDRSLRRLSVITSGGVRKSWLLNEEARFDTPADPDGMASSQEVVLRRIVAPLASRPGSARPTEEVLVLNLANKQLYSIDTIVGTEVFIRVSSSGGRVLGTPPIQRSTLVAVGGGRIATADTDSGTIHVSSLSGNNARHFLVLDGNRTLTDAGMRARLDELFAQRGGSSRDVWERFQREMIDVRQFPAFEELRLFDGSYLWIKRS